MPTKIKTWEIKGSQNIEEIDTSMRKEREKEKRLQEWIVQKPEIVHENLEILGSGVPIDGREIDILGFLPDGSLVVVELKRKKGSRETIAQAIDYASRLADKDLNRLGESIKDDEIEENLEESLNQGKLEKSDLKEKPRIMIVASEIDEATSSMIDYLSEIYQVPINGIVFSYSKLSDGSEIISRTAVVSEEEIDDRVSLTKDKLKKIAENNSIGEIVNNTLREKLRNFAREVPYDAVRYGKSLRYWESGKVICGIRVEESESNKVRLWINQGSIADIGNLDSQKVVESLKENFEVYKPEGKSKAFPLLKNTTEAEEFVDWLKQKVTL
ncbi:hypothetical protein AKJ61_02480 [candidate division MSBL1 archaeon SCGC-AAA259B11]|uniref:DUF91 domain-containing protein n=1 Tax=candidate division MSBL1 archaeon SCGC-AAA259B11 TaxID=1698260 RepID=A0A133U607_9EURY|nr:hypothetical protein AKJ61_02480 [candidate division MSBL1 archaeon SCGC-AAA259B11]